MIQLHSIVLEYPLFPSPFIKKTILFPLCIFGSLVENQVTVYMWLYLGAPFSIVLVSMSVFMPAPHCFVYCSFVIYLEIRKCDASSFVLLNIGLAILYFPISEKQ